jgi:hypothetical protein
MGTKFLFLGGWAGSVTLVEWYKDGKLSIVGVGYKEDGGWWEEEEGDVGDSNKRALDTSNWEIVNKRKRREIVHQEQTGSEEIKKTKTKVR